MRARYRARLPRVCSVPGYPRAAEVQDSSTGVGGTVQETYPEPERTGIRCSFSSSSGNVAEVEGSLTQMVSHQMRFEWGVELQTGMRVNVEASEEDPTARRFLLITPLHHPFAVGQVWTAKEL
jgi:hypothetical protein